MKNSREAMAVPSDQVGLQSLSDAQIDRDAEADAAADRKQPITSKRS